MKEVFVQAAQALALRVLKEGGADEPARAGFLFELCTGRPPTSAERRRLLAFWDERSRYFEDRTAAAVSVAVADPKQLPPEVNLHKAAAWFLTYSFSYVLYCPITMLENDAGRIAGCRLELTIHALAQRLRSGAAYDGCLT